jgi:hypothetical protein
MVARTVELLELILFSSRVVPIRTNQYLTVSRSQTNYYPHPPHRIKSGLLSVKECELRLACSGTPIARDPDLAVNYWEQVRIVYSYCESSCFFATGAPIFSVLSGRLAHRDIRQGWWLLMGC